MPSRHFDYKRLYAALEDKKTREDVSWRQVARKLEIADHGIFGRLAKGTSVTPDTLLTLTDWLGMDLMSFAVGQERRDTREDTLGVIRTYLEADPDLKPDNVLAIHSVLTAAYQHLSEKPSKPGLPSNHKPLTV